MGATAPPGHTDKNNKRYVPNNKKAQATYLKGSFGSP